MHQTSRSWMKMRNTKKKKMNMIWYVQDGLVYHTNSFVLFFFCTINCEYFVSKIFRAIQINDPALH